MPLYSIDKMSVFTTMSDVKNGPNRGWSMMDLQIFFSPTPEAPSSAAKSIFALAPPPSSSLFSSSVIRPSSWRFARASCSFFSCAASFSISSVASCSFASVFSSSYTSVITASARLSRKNPPVNTSRTK
jgi:hypothetical protein